MEMSLSKREQETVITFNEAEPNATVYTYNGKLKRRLAVAFHDRPEEITLEHQDMTGAVQYSVPKKWVKVNPGRILTAEQMEELKERGRKLKLSQNP